MALQKQSININFSKGLETKDDPFQVPAGNFLSLRNSVFSTGGRLQKRNGYGALAALPDTTSTFATTFNGDLTAIGNKLEAYSSGTQSWTNKGYITPVDLSVMPLIRNNTNQSQCDTAVSDTGLVCTVYTDQNPSNLSANISRYAVADSETGQNVIAPATISDADATYGSPRVFLLGTYFIIVYTNKVSSLYHLKYIAINTLTFAVSASVDISTSYTPASTVAFDAAVLNNTLYVAWNGAAASGIKMSTLSSHLSLSSTIVVDAAHVATMVSVCADVQNSVVWVAYYDVSGTTGYVLARNPSLISVLAATQIISSGTMLNITSSAQSGTLTVFYEVSNNYSYDSSVPSHYVQSKTCTQAGVVGSATTILRSVGLASKSFISGSTIYFVCTYSSTYQPTYFLANSSGNLLAKLAYQNGGGYLTTGLPSVIVDGSDLSFPYLIKDLIQSVNKDTNVASGTQTAGIYSQTGINRALITIGTGIQSSEIGNNLNLSGGFLWSYDGYAATEQNFHVYPDVTSGGVTALTDPVTTGDSTSGSAVLINLASTTGIAVGMHITGTGIPANTLVSVVGTGTITLNKNATSTAATTTFTFTGNQSAQQYFYVATYEWTDNQGNAFRSAPSIPQTVTTSAGHSSASIYIPTLRLTYKTANAVKIVLYRWSTAQQSYYQVTSLTAPYLNSLTADTVQIIDTVTDASILGNNLLYTTGGVVENIGPPACSSSFIFDNRLWLIPSENPDNLLFSKQVIPVTPVEFSDLFSQFVSPTTSSQGPSGPTRCGFPMDDKAIIFKNASILYFNGAGPDNTGANNQYSQPILITATVGCSNPKSIVFQPQGLMFEFASEAGNGIWLLGRDLSTRYIGAAVEAFTQNATVQSAVNIPGTNQVRFTLSSGVTLMYDYYYQQWGTFYGVPAVSSTLFQGLHTYINSSGQVFQETPGTYVDGSSPVLMSFTTSWLNMAGVQGYQRAYYFFLLANYLSPHKLSMQIGYDYNPYPSQAYVITPDNFAGTYGDDATYGSGSPYGGASPIEQWRNSFSQQRCQAFQITLTEIFDPSHNTAPGAGFTLSGINVVFGVKKAWPRLPAYRQTG